MWSKRRWSVTWKPCLTKHPARWKSLTNLLNREKFQKQKRRNKKQKEHSSSESREMPRELIFSSMVKAVWRKICPWSLILSASYIPAESCVFALWRQNSKRTKKPGRKSIALAHQCIRDLCCLRRHWGCCCFCLGQVTGVCGHYSLHFWFHVMEIKWT